MATGTIKNVIAEKGFGFITPQGAGEGDRDIFFHFSALVGGLQLESLNKGDVVEFETEQGPRGINAKNVRLAASHSDDSVASDDDTSSDEDNSMEDAA